MPLLGVGGMGRALPPMSASNLLLRQSQYWPDCHRPPSSPQTLPTGSINNNWTVLVHLDMLTAPGEEHYSGVFDDFLPSTQAWTPSCHYGSAPGCDWRATPYLGHCLNIKEMGWPVELWVIIHFVEMHKGSRKTKALLSKNKYSSSGPCR